MQLIKKLKTSFEVTRTICQCYKELDSFFFRKREDIIDYIERAQNLYADIIEAEKHKKGSLRMF